jgi:enterobacteria phage integrase
MVGRRGTIIRLRYIHRFVDRHGTPRYYFRRHGIRTSLPGQPGEPAFIDAYQRALQGAESVSPVPARPAHPQGSLGALITFYKSSLGFKRNKPRTQHVTRLILDRFASNHGHRLVKQMKRSHVEKILADMASTPAAANDLLKKLRRLMDFARAIGWRLDDPCSGITPFKSGTHHTWTDQQLDAFEAAWPIGTKERTAYALHLFTAQRSQDVRQMTWADATGDAIRVVQGKTGERLTIPIHPELRRALKAHHREHHLIIATAFGRPFTEKGYGQWMAKAIDELVCPQNA